MPTNKDAERRIRYCQRDLGTIQPFFHSLMLRTPKLADTSIETLGCDGDNIYYNPEWVMGHSGDQVKAAMSRVVLACALKHHTRRGERDYNIWQEASRQVTMPMLNDAGLTNEEPFLNGASDMSVEQAYRALEQIMDKSKDQPEQDDGGDNGSPTAGLSIGSGSGSSDNSSPDPGGHGEVKDAPRPENKADDKGEIQKQEEKWDDMRQQAIHQAVQNPGNQPGKFMQDLMAQSSRRVDWRTALRRFMTTAAKGDYTWAQPNRRFISSGIYLPTLYSEGMESMVFAIDTSGSINREALQLLWGELRSAVKEIMPDRVTVIQCDSRVQSVEHYSAMNLPEQITAYGRGGTRFNPVFDEVANYPRPACLVYFTDMGTGDVPVDPGYPVMWASVDRFNGIPLPTFGEVIEVGSSY